MPQDGQRTELAVEHSTAQVPPRTVDYDTLLRIGRDLLVALGEDPDREGLQDTPRRFAAFWKEFVEYDPGNIDALFEVVSTNQMVIVSGIRVWSVCEHHLLPFWCDLHIGYIATDKVLGLSKFARIAHQFAHRPQVQERLVHEIADEIERLVETPDVAVIGRGTHLCMIMRGIRTPAEMVTSVMRGAFRQDALVQSEFIQLTREPR
jgi:GTP cyclohydrolase I